MLEYHPDIVWRDIDTIIPYINNTKKHPEEQVGKLAGSIAEFGFDQPIVIDGDGVIIKGHGRMLAAKKLQLQQVPVIVRTDLTPVQAKAARIADNRVAQSQWDDELLKLELEELKAESFDLALTGFEDWEIGNALGEAWETDLDQIGKIQETSESSESFVKIVCQSADKPDLINYLNQVLPDSGLTGLKVV